MILLGRAHKLGIAAVPAHHVTHSSHQQGINEGQKIYGHIINVGCHFETMVHVTLSQNVAVLQGHYCQYELTYIACSGM